MKEVQTITITKRIVALDLVLPINADLMIFFNVEKNGIWWRTFVWIKSFRSRFWKPNACLEGYWWWIFQRSLKGSRLWYKVLNNLSEFVFQGFREILFYFLISSLVVVSGKVFRMITYLFVQTFKGLFSFHLILVTCLVNTQNVSYGWF